MSVCLSVRLSGYTFRHALISHAEILDSDWGHIFRKYRRKNNKKITLIYEKTVKNLPLPGYLPPVAMLIRGAYVNNAIFCVRFAYTHDIFHAKTLRAYGRLPPGR